MSQERVERNMQGLQQRLGEIIKEYPEFSDIGAVIVWKDDFVKSSGLQGSLPQFAVASVSPGMGTVAHMRDLATLVSSISTTLFVNSVNSAIHRAEDLHQQLEAAKAEPKQE